MSKRVRAFQFELELLVFKERWKAVYPGKHLSEKGREPTTNSTDMLSVPGFDPGPHLWEASALTTAPPLLPIAIFEALEQINTGTFDVHHALILKIMKWNWKWKWKWNSYLRTSPSNILYLKLHKLTFMNWNNYEGEQFAQCHLTMAKD